MIINSPLGKAILISQNTSEVDMIKKKGKKNMEGQCMYIPLFLVQVGAIS